jgi:NADH-quinone oxidoreductase subunit L
MYELIKLVPLFPLVGFISLGLLGKKIKNEAVIATIGSGMVGLSFAVICYIFFSMLGDLPEHAEIVPVFTWIAAGQFEVALSYQVDQLSVLFTMVITGVGFLIHVYSAGYMHGDRSFYRFFTYLNLFIFMMLNLVLGSNYLVTFLGWEGVGLSSYLLIGFWYDKKFPGVKITWTGDAANKAFIVNRIGDFGFLIAMFLIFVNFGTLDYGTVMESASLGASNYYNTGLLTAITLLLFLGCTGKSAQIPLAVWLPDAMAGPTPVSALIHAATMVTAGIFLIARNSVLFALAPETMQVVMWVGIGTAFLAASVGIVQNDFKKVLAYSTVSQLGFMFAALGVGAFATGVFHVMTHAFFKGLLFLAAGAVIHGMHDEQNIKKMGGLKAHMPKTYWTFVFATLAIAGIPFFSGFFSKDEILWYTNMNGGFVAWLILAMAAFFTAFYMWRLLKLVFHGEERFDHKHVHPHEAPNSMTIPLIILAFLSIFGGFLGVPHVLGHPIHFPNLLEIWFDPIFSDAKDIILSRGPAHAHPPDWVEFVYMGISVAIAGFAIFLAHKFYKDENWTTPRSLAKNFRPIYRMLLNKYRLDEIYHVVVVSPLIETSRSFLHQIFDVKIIDGIVNGSAKLIEATGQGIRRMQTGIAQNYAVLMMLGIIFVIAWLAF